jgi:EAL domain-containing protein (putative c-di-GMP-specific phosphodiesterase class I)
MKLEPIVDLSTLHTIGVEVLSLLAPPLQSEAWFQRLSAKQTLDLLQAQCEMLKNRLPWHNLFINLPITLLTEVDLFRLLLPLPGPGANIEIVEPAQLLSLPDATRNRAIDHLHMLSERGCRIWLDDIDEAQIHGFIASHLPLSGIKIDKMAFWRLKSTPALLSLVNLCAKIAQHILIEGIESPEDLALARQAGAGFGQGYLWPSVGRRDG